ncbi:MAG: molecular chaperone DnaJ [Alphaproteobacteria bacterium]|nr:molecular chaperone DnaJ [Alphaproteobacteria bacterium]
MSKADYYEILEVAKTATGEEIKKAYHKLAMKYHPDRNAGDEKAEAKFKEINEAYEILKDEQKRAAYDRYGHAAFEQGGGANPFDFNFGGAGGFTDIFTEVFSEFMNGGKRASSATSGLDGDDLRYDVEINLLDAYNGVEKNISFNTTKACETCHGHGTKDGNPAPICPTCKGSGRVHHQHGFMIMENICPDCRGSGRKASEVCTDCHGNGFIKHKKELKIKIPAGVDDGTRIRVAGEGAAGIRGGKNGDLYVFVNVKAHKLYERRGFDLYAKIPVSMACAALGGCVEIPSVDGRKLELKIPLGTQNGHKLRIKGEGMPVLQSSAKGDLWIEVAVETPVNLTARQKELLEEFRTISGESNCQPEEKSFLDKIKDLFKAA